ncbi:hypothetical protein DXG01_005505 [Tephrocybe rancida]|nr:hypothetical protein DXG01_005505 [Tephrocybe rancida]
MKAGPSKLSRTTLPRASKKRKPDASSAIPGEEADILETVHVIKKAAKKRTKGKLSGLIDLPIDVLFEIFGHLKPFDLLKVARVTKEFRRLLMHKTSRSVWQAALKSIHDLPPCPTNMDEPAWVNLVFDPHCHFCIKATVRTVEWVLRVRICSKCAKKKIIEITPFSAIASAGMRWAPEDEVQTKEYDFLRQCLWSVQSQPGKKVNSKYVIRDRLIEMKDKVAALTDDNARNAFLHERRQVLSDIETPLKRLQHAALCVTWAQAQATDRSFELEQLRDERLKAVIEKLKGLGYEKDIASIRPPHSLADHELVKKPQKLTERIWANIREGILKFMDQMRKIRLEREHIQRLHNRQSSAVTVFRGYMTSHYPYTDMMPSGLDFCGFPPVKKILEQPDEVDVDEASFADIVPLIPDFIASWSQSVDRHLREVAKSSRPYSEGRDWNAFDEFVGDIGDGDPDDTLSVKHKLATTVYSCSYCTFEDVTFISGYDSSDDSDDGLLLRQPLFYPKVKGHRCLVQRKNYSWWADPEEAANPARKLGGSHYIQRKQWSAKPLSVNAKLGECVKVLVEKAGLDPDTTTAEEMDDLGHWFACLRCARDCGEKKEKPEDGHAYELPAFTWRFASQIDRGLLTYVKLEHILKEHHRNHTESAWTKIDSDKIDNAVEAFEQNPKSTHQTSSNMIGTIIPARNDASWSCVHCRDTAAEVVPTSLQILKIHLVEKHDSIPAKENIDYYRDFAAVPPTEHQSRQVVLSLVGSDAQQVTLKSKTLEHSFELDFGQWFNP